MPDVRLRRTSSSLRRTSQTFLRVSASHTWYLSWPDHGMYFLVRRYLGEKAVEMKGEHDGSG